MEEKKKGKGTIFDFLERFLCIFGFTMICMLVFTKLFGESARGYSSFFILGEQGVPTAVMAEMLLMAVLVTAISSLSDSEWMSAKLSAGVRIVCTLAVILLLVAAFVAVFGWFPVTMWEPWVMFFVCYGICAAGSIAVSVLRTHLENKKLEEGLARIKARWEEEDDDENR